MKSAILFLVLSIAAFADDTTAPPSFLVANNDIIGGDPRSGANFYTIASDGSLSTPTTVRVFGSGIAGGYFGTNRALVLPENNDACVYISDSQSENVAGIPYSTQKPAGVFRGSHFDSSYADVNGLAMAISPTYLYAAFSGVATIGTFQIQPGCKLKFVGDVKTQGLNGGVINSMALNGNMLVVAYGDGSIESFNISGGLPVSNGDAQLATGAQDDHLPDAVDITQDGHYAIFGDASTVTTVEVSDLTSGKLAATVPYNLGTNWNSGYVRLSPDESVLFISNTSGGGVTAAFFDKGTGALTPGCTSGPLKGFYKDFAYAGGLVSQTATGTGGALYVAEFGTGSKSSIGILNFVSTGTTCSFTEAAASPVAAAHLSALLSIAVYPPRPF